MNALVSPCSANAHQSLVGSKQESIEISLYSHEEIVQVNHRLPLLLTSLVALLSILTYTVPYIEAEYPTANYNSNGLTFLYIVL